MNIPQNPNGQATMANSQPVVIASNQSAIPVIETTTDTAPATQNITVVDSGSTSTAASNGQVLVTGSPTAGSAASFVISSLETVRVQVTGTWTGTIASEISIDGGTTWFAQGLHQGAYTTSTFFGNFVGGGSITGATNFRMRATATITGTATVKIIESLNTNSVYVANAAPAGNVVSLLNSSTATLTSGSVFTGSGEDVANFSEMRISVISNVASATDGLSIQQSPDNTNWDITDVYTIAAATGKTFVVPRQARYFRVVYTNGGTNQTSFRLQSILNRTASSPSSNRASDGYTNETDLEQNQVFLMGYNGTTWDRLRSTGTGILNVLLAAGSAVIGHVITDSGSTTAATQATAANLNATIVGTGTLAVQNTAATPAGSNVIGHVITDSGSTTAVTGTVTANQGTAAALTAGWPVVNGEATDASGTFTNATQTTSITASSLDGYGNFLLSINGTYGTATAVFEGSDDGGTTYYTLNASRDDTNVIETGYTSLTNTNRTWQINNPGMDSIRIRSTAVASGTVNVRISPSAAPGASGATVAIGTALPTGTNTIGALTANQSMNVSQINGVTPLMGNGVTGAGSQRVTIASDNTAFAVNATLSAETTKVIGTVNQGTNPWVTSNTTTSVVGNGAAATAQRVTLANDSTGIIATVGAVTAITNALPTGTNSLGKISDITTSVVPGTAATNLGKAEDAAHASGDTGVYVMGTRQDTPTATAGTSGDYQGAAYSPQGAEWTSLTPSLGGGWTVSSQTALTNTKISIVAGAATFGGYYFYNPNATAAYIQVFNTLTGSVTLGTTPPFYVLSLPATAGGNLEIANGIKHDTALVVAATTTATGSTAPGTAVTGFFMYR